jgi:hypothetical protein
MKTIRLLTIGNSFSDNALTYLEGIAAASGRARFIVGRASLGGCSLEKHWNLAAYTGVHPEYKPYRVGTDASGAARMATLQEALAWMPWDVVTLQQVSANSWRRETFQPYLGQLHGLVRKLAPQAEVRLHQTWAYRTDSPFLPQNAITQEGMFERIRGNYRHYAAEFSCGVLPSGEAVQRARRAEGRTFTWPEPDYDYQHAKAPALPEQANSLAVGWHWGIADTATGVPELRLDANHLNAKGCYLAGCVWFECLTRLSVLDPEFVPDGIDRETAAFLRGVAHETVRDHEDAKTGR